MRPIRLLVGTAVAVATALSAACASSDTPGSGSAASTSPKLTSNGVANLSANEILAKAQAALPKARTVHVSGGGTDDGEDFQLDVRIKGTEGGRGTLNFNKQKVEIIRIGQTGYLKADQAFWTTRLGNAQVGKLLNGKYLKGPATDDNLKSLMNFTDMTSLAKEMLDPDGTITKGERKTIRGIEAIGLVDGSADGGILYVATQGEPYPLQLAAGAKSGSSGALDFLDYGEPVELTAPPEAQVIDTSQLPKR